MSTLDIVQLIEKNPITRLSKDYENKLINKVKTSFSDTQQQLFVASFYCYLNFNSKKDFVINLNDVWKWIGFSRKDHAKTRLEKHFTIDIDYKIIFPQSRENKNKEETRGRKEETIMLTINTFKKFCLKSETKKADEVHDYFIKLEELLQETINEQSDELIKQLEYKDSKIEELKTENKSLSKHVVRKYNTKYKPGNCVYFVSSTEIKNKFKVGNTININHRLTQLSTSSPYYFEVLELYYTEFHELLEKTIKEVFGKYRTTVNCEWFDLEIIDEMKEFVKNILTVYNEFKGNSNIDVPDQINIIEDDDQKKCLDCDEILNLINFFKVDKKNKIFEDLCIPCYEKKHGESKQCSACEKIKNKHEFVVDRSKKDGLTYECKECRYEQNKKRKEERTKKNPNVGKLECSKCKNFEELKMFYRTRLADGKYEYFKECKQCYCEENGKSKQCFTCQKVKNETHFDKSAANSDGLSCYCKDCRQNERDKKKAEKKETEDENKGKTQCKKCELYFRQNMFFKKNFADEITYYDECKTCHSPDCLQCSKCKEIKETANFSRDSTKNTGFRTICKKCTSTKK